MFNLKDELVYDYCEVEAGESQYEEEGDTNSFVLCPTVDAKYVKPPLECYRGNFFIEALPVYKEEDHTRFDRRMKGYRRNEIENMSYAQKLLAVQELKNVRFELSYYDSVSYEIYRCILQTYSSKQLLASDDTFELTVNGKPMSCNGYLVENSAESTNGSFSLLGSAGSGKSAAIKLALDGYPRCIIHRLKSGGHFIQIPWLVINCSPNSNFSQLFVSIGAAIDIAVGNTEEHFSSMIAHFRTLGDKSECVIRLISKFNIGIIILDEIQNLKFENTKDGTFEQFLNIANRTKVSIVVVGTEDARRKMFKYARTARRLGRDIVSDNYCTDIEFFSSIVKRLLRYQWLDKKIELTQGLIDTLYKYSFGIIAHLISLYVAATTEYLRRQHNGQKNLSFNAEFVEKVAKQYYGNLYSVMPALNTVEGEKTYRVYKEAGDALVNKIVDDAKQNERLRALKENVEKDNDNKDLLDTVLNSLGFLDKYSTKDIERAFFKIIKDNSFDKNSPADVRRLCNAVVNLIDVEKAKKKVSKSAPRPKAFDGLTVEELREKVGFPGSKEE